MSLPYIRKYYEVPAYRGAWIMYCGRSYIIRSARDAYLRVSPFADDSRRLLIHPTWRVAYIKERRAAR